MDSDKQRNLVVARNLVDGVNELIRLMNDLPEEDDDAFTATVRAFLRERGAELNGAKKKVADYIGGAN